VSVEQGAIERQHGGREVEREAVSGAGRGAEKEGQREREADERERATTRRFLRV
jgi:hypothetical protein